MVSIYFSLIVNCPYFPIWDIKVQSYHILSCLLLGFGRYNHDQSSRRDGVTPHNSNCAIDAHRWWEKARQAEDVILSMTDRFSLFINGPDRRAEIETERDRLNMRGESKSAERLLKIHNFPPAGENNLSFLINDYQSSRKVRIKTHFMTLNYEPLLLHVRHY